MKHGSSLQEVILPKELIWNSIFTFDSREVSKNSVFVALTTGNLDGNNFAQAAFNLGAKFLILSKEPDFKINRDKFIVVEDTLSYVSHLAHEKFEEMKTAGVKTISLTGSVGKTTTKDFLVYLLKKQGKRVFGTFGNFNNHIGLPITILNAPANLEFLVLEMGMNHVGEISALNKIANTDIKIITNISKAHVGNFARGLAEIAKAKSEILEDSTPEKVFFAREDLAFLQDCLKDFKGHFISISKPLNYKIEGEKTYFEAFDQSYFLNKIVTLEWLYSLMNGLSVLNFLHISLPSDISDFLPPKGRGDEIKIGNNTILIDESYNAGPVSMRNAVETFKLLPLSKKLIVLGGMKELGVEEPEEHLKILQSLSGLENVILVGAEFEKVLPKEHLYKHYKDVFALIEKFSTERSKEFEVILVKSSKSSLLSKFVEHLKIT